MIVYVDGFQNCGKTTLLEHCNYKHSRFPFNEYLYKFDLTDDLNTFQLTKDLGIVFAGQFITDNIVLDRGPLSTAFYSLKEKRFGDKTGQVIFSFLKEIAQYQSRAFVFVKKINDNNPVKRMHRDGFDYLNDDEDTEKDKTLNEMIYLARSANIKVVIFENDFSKSIEENCTNFNKLIEDIINEYN